ncbi:CBL-interacting serine/threonine-protein kinase 25-like [Amaranthus tricolor]|uniref:CBL-interacting serine/threonine-protein kinase 25-like n=1 Tax=Amaranthus tricolor TaxID=29722 RepID=UPI00258EFA63|nr:CBL-interacting serine/threonine-protein kinase 25-like [Amaranthus tricolor]
MEGKVLFSKYELEKLLGEGNFGKVYKAKNLTTLEIVAIKMINKDEVKKHGMIEQVKKEIQVMSHVKHPNIIELKEVMATKTKIYLVLEYVGGGDLYTKIVENGKFDENLARKIFQQLIIALDFCHYHGVCHRDLKLENVLMDSNGEDLKICDFGLATFLGGHEQNYDFEDVLLYTACGAIAYMAPEIIRGDRYDGKKCDIWSCGVILYTLLVGYPPFQDESRTRMLWKIRVGKFDFPLGFSKEVEDLIKKILVPNPSERIVMLDIMQHPWFTKGLNRSCENDYSNLFCSSPISSFNAFDFVSSMGSGLDLSGLFESTHKRKLSSLFVSKCSTKEVVKKVEIMAKELKYEARKEKESRVVLRGEVGRRGRLVVVVEVFRVSSEVNIIEFTKRVGDSIEYLKFMEEEVRPAMKDVVWKWQGEWSIVKKNSGGNVISFPKWKWC